MNLFRPLPLLAAALTFAAWSYATYPAVGQLTYDVASYSESHLYGLHKERVVVDGVPMVLYRSNGSGEPILMLHGFSADKDVWVRFARHFARTHQVIIPDMAGHGETGFKPEWDYSVPAQAARLVKLLDQLGIKQAHVIGNSMGGYITAQMALSYPGRVLSAGLVDPAGLPQPHPSELETQLAQGHNPFLIESRQDFARFYPMTMASPPPMPGFVLDAIAEQYIARRSQLEVIFKQARQPTDLPARVGQIKAPTLLLWGKLDRLIDVSAVPVWQAALPRAQVAVWDGIGHMPMVERPAESAELYAAFIKGPRAPAP
jgi:pimeloyl-ACP methyl ester carboxylesterase